MQENFLTKLEFFFLESTGWVLRARDQLFYFFYQVLTLLNYRFRNNFRSLDFGIKSVTKICWFLIWETLKWNRGKHGTGWLLLVQAPVPQPRTVWLLTIWCKKEILNMIFDGIEVIIISFPHPKKLGAANWL